MSVSILNPNETASPLKRVRSADLLAQTESLAREERRITAELLLHLREIEARRLYADLGYSSLFEFVVKHLRYSESSASRRISAMRALRDSDEISSDSKTLKAVKDGRVSVTSLSALQGFFREKERQEGSPVARAEKQEWIARIEGKGSRECERIFAQALPEEPAQPDRSRAVSASRTELRFTIGRELEEKLARVSALLSHRNAHPTYEELLTMMADLVIARLDPREQEMRGQREPKQMKSEQMKSEQMKSEQMKSEQMKSEQIECGRKPPEQKLKLPSLSSSSPRDCRSASPAPKPTRFIHRAIVRGVWKRDEGKCTFRSMQTGHVCGSAHLIQLDHIQPFALGGANTIENLRLRCALCRIRHKRHYAESGIMPSAA